MSKAPAALNAAGAIALASASMKHAFLVGVFVAVPALGGDFQKGDEL